MKGSWDNFNTLFPYYGWWNSARSLPVKQGVMGVSILCLWGELVIPSSCTGLVPQILTSQLNFTYTLEFTNQSWHSTSILSVWWSHIFCDPQLRFACHSEPCRNSIPCQHCFLPKALREWQQQLNYLAAFQNNISQSKVRQQPQPLSVIKHKHHVCVACAVATTAVILIQLKGLEGRPVVFHKRSSLQAVP